MVQVQADHGPSEHLGLQKRSGVRSHDDPRLRGESGTFPPGSPDVKLEVAKLREKRISIGIIRPNESYFAAVGRQVLLAGLQLRVELSVGTVQQEVAVIESQQLQTGEVPGILAKERIEKRKLIQYVRITEYAGVWKPVRDATAELALDLPEDCPVYELSFGEQDKVRSVCAAHHQQLARYHGGGQSVTHEGDFSQRMTAVFEDLYGVPRTQKGTLDGPSERAVKMNADENNPHEFRPRTVVIRNPACEGSNRLVSPDISQTL
jgi:hypothetical protein